MKTKADYLREAIRSWLSFKGKQKTSVVITMLEAFFANESEDEKSLALCYAWDIAEDYNNVLNYAAFCRYLEVAKNVHSIKTKW